MICATASGSDAVVGPVNPQAGPDPTASALDPLAVALLRALAAEAPDAAVSLPRLVKQLGLGASVLMRQLTQMSDARIGGESGPGWVRVWPQDGGWRAQLTASGRAQAESLSKS